MTRRLLLLNGLAVLAVAINHAAHTGPIVMFWWTFRYSPGASVPNYDQFGSLTYYALIALIKLSFFAVPAFLFVSGYFVSFVSRGKRSAMSWGWVRVTLVSLLVPFVIWSLVSFFFDWLSSCLDACTTRSLGEYVILLFTGRAQDAYWYVILVCQFYLLSPFLVVLAKKHLRLLLLFAVLTHVCTMLVIYVDLFVDVPEIAYTVFYGRLFPRELIYFVLGMAVGLHATELRGWLLRYKWFLLVALCITAILSIVEAEFIYRIRGGGYSYLNHVKGGEVTLPTTLYTFLFIMCFLAFENFKYPFSKTLNQLGAKSYGIYLIHPILILFIPKVLYNFAPWLLGHQILYQPVLVAFAVGIPILLMNFVAKSRFQRSYRYLFR